MAGVAVLSLSLTASAQVPFSSTQSPGLSPFNRGGGGLSPAATPPPRQQPPQGNPGGMSPYGNNNPGGYPMALAVTAAPDADHKLGPRDQLSYSVDEDRDSKVYQLVVTDSGDLELPVVNLRVKASGKTTPQLTSDIKSALEREYYRPGHATVRVGLTYSAPNASKGRVYITGEVASKGAIDLPANGQLTVVQAILQLGGFTQEADLKRVFVFRNGASKDGLRVNAKAVLNGENDKDVVLQPDDKVKVDRKIIGVQW